MSLWLSHPTGNTFVRALLGALSGAQADFRFFTTLGFSSTPAWLQFLPRSTRSQLARRSYEIPSSNFSAKPLRELGRLIWERLGISPAAEGHPLSIDAVYRDLDRKVARQILSETRPPNAVYAYEDGALETFKAARNRGLARIYDLPIAHWETSRRLLSEEAARYPDWEPTLRATRDSQAKLERKSEELELAETVVCPSEFVLESLPTEIRRRKRCVTAPFGSPGLAPQRPNPSGGKLRVLFAGILTQRKGLADVFAAMRLLRSASIELVVLGSPVLPMAFYRQGFSNLVYEAPRNHAAVLELMTTCDVLALPSIVEGRALVQQEALACGLPLIVTPNAGGTDLIDPSTGFLVPIRAPERIAEKIDWFASNRRELEWMRESCRRKAAQYTWEAYSHQVLSAIPSLN